MSPSTHEVPESGWKSAPPLIAVAFVILLMGVPERPLTREEAAAERSYFAVQRAVEELRAAAEEYRRDHDAWPGIAPGRRADARLDEDWFVRQLTLASDVTGAVVPLPEPDYPLGPYLVNGIPDNPVNGLASVRFVAEADMLEAADGKSGWLFDPRTGTIRVGAPGAIPGGPPYVDL